MGDMVSMTSAVIDGHYDCDNGGEYHCTCIIKKLVHRYSSSL